MSFWKKLAIAAAVVVAVVVVSAAVAAATVATGGAAGAALCAAGTVLAGAAKGALVGAAVGAATGAVVGGVQGAVEGYQETGTVEGTLRGMGKGAVKGAVQGAADGMISGMVSGAFAGAAMSMSGNPMFCFVAGTTVLTTLGKKTIETIQVGDTIPCVDHITGESAEKRVITTTVNKVDRLIELDIDGEIIHCTETHPFQVKGRGWVNASNLAPNDIVYAKDWNTATVKSVNLIELDEPVEVFNFEVEDCHTYFVGDNFVLVHNASCTQQGSYEIFAKNKKGIDQVYVGKGPQSRMQASMRRLQRQGYTITSSPQWTPAANSKIAFIDEYMKMSKYDFDFGGKLINKIMSPGFKIFNSWL